MIQAHSVVKNKSRTDECKLYIARISKKSQNQVNGF